MASEVKNNGKSVRVVNMRMGERVRQVSIEPGATVTGEPVETKVFKALKSSGVLSVSAEQKPARKSEEKSDDK